MTEPKPIIVRGKHNEAAVYAKALESACEDKIKQYLDHPAFSGTQVRIMPDVHLGKSTVIGFTASCNDLVIPSLVGLDIGCGVCACNLGKGPLRFDKLDRFIRKNIPSGMGTHSAMPEQLERAAAFVAAFAGKPFSREASGLESVQPFKKSLRAICEKQNHSIERIFSSLGTLGGGNHFIEIDVDENHNRWLLIHSGSRILGARTAEYHEIRALRQTPAESPLKYLSGESAADYKEDMRVVQHYARINRALMALVIAEGFFKIDMEETEYLDSMHNYIDFVHNIVRKGAISASGGERLVIPFSMSEGAVLGRGKGNAEWNCSAPHGAGRKISRGQARQGLSLDEYRKEMRGVWSSTVCKETLDESPMAYKKAKDILSFLPDTVEVEQRLKPLYNFKAVE